MEFTEQGNGSSIAMSVRRGLSSVCAGGEREALPGGSTGSGETAGSRARSGAGGAGAEPQQNRGWGFYLFLVFFFSLISVSPPCVFSSRKPTRRYFSNARCIFHPATAAWFCQAPFLLRSSFKGKKKKRKLEATDRQMLLVMGGFFCRHTLCFLNYDYFYICLIVSGRGEHRGGFAGLGCAAMAGCLFVLINML